MLGCCSSAHRSASGSALARDGPAANLAQELHRDHVGTVSEMTMDVAVTKGAGGFGMNIDQEGFVTSFSGEDSAAKLAGVPVKSQIVRAPTTP